MIEEDDEEQSLDLTDWVTHPQTKLLLAQAEQKAKAALESLVNACGGSTDIRIVQKYSQYEHFRGISTLLRHGKAKKE
jgi:hypothetical protein